MARARNRRTRLYDEHPRLWRALTAAESALGVAAVALLWAAAVVARAPMFAFVLLAGMTLVVVGGGAGVYAAKRRRPDESVDDLIQRVPIAPVAGVLTVLGFVVTGVALAWSVAWLFARIAAGLL